MHRLLTPASCARDGRFRRMACPQLDLHDYISGILCCGHSEDITTPDHLLCISNMSMAMNAGVRPCGQALAAGRCLPCAPMLHTSPLRRWVCLIRLPMHTA